MRGIEIAALKVLTLKDPGKLWSFQRHNPAPVPVDILVLHPDHPDGKKHKDRKEYPIFAGLHATLAGVDYICRLAWLSDDQILAAADSNHTEAIVHTWLVRGYEMFPWGVAGARLAEAGTQLEVAVKQGINRVIQG